MCWDRRLILSGERLGQAAGASRVATKFVFLQKKNLRLRFLPNGEPLFPRSSDVAPPQQPRNVRDSHDVSCCRQRAAISPLHSARERNLRPQPCRTNVRRVGRFARSNNDTTSAKVFFDTFIAFVHGRDRSGRTGGGESRVRV